MLSKLAGENLIWTRVTWTPGVRITVGQKRVIVLKVEDQQHPATRMLGASWPLVDEFYQFGTAPWHASRPDEKIDVLFKNKIPVGFSRGCVRVLLSIDTKETDMIGCATNL